MRQTNGPKLAFSARLQCCRKGRFRTAQLAVPNQFLSNSGAIANLAEREGFEPSERLRAQRFSRPPRSTTPAPLRKGRVCSTNFEKQKTTESGRALGESRAFGPGGRRGQAGNPRLRRRRVGGYLRTPRNAISPLSSASRAALSVHFMCVISSLFAGRSRPASTTVRRPRAT